jgi:hypothetical protein
MYHINRNGSTSGPYTETVFFQMLASGQVLATDLVWKEGEPDWRPATDYPGLSRSAPPPMPGQGPYAQYAPPVSPIHMQQGGPPLPTYLWQSIVVTILCCWPLGIPAIVFAASVGGKQASGNYAAAKEASDKARFWCWMAFGLGIPINILVYYLVYRENPNY